MDQKWKSKQQRKERRQSHTPGNTKGVRCQATSLERYIARRNRSYKHPVYASVLHRWDRKVNG